jgi:hypothetical protein
MKKAKIMLSSIAIFAIVGGALAFNSAKFGAIPVYTDNGATCTFVGNYTLEPNPSPVVFTNATTDPNAATCESTITVYAE